MQNSIPPTHTAHPSLSSVLESGRVNMARRTVSYCFICYSLILHAISELYVLYYNYYPYERSFVADQNSLKTTIG